MPLTWDPKDPDEVLDYALDWADRLAAGDTIDTSLWILPAGITKDNEGIDGANTVIWLSGGTLGGSYDLVNRITTTGGRTHDQTVRVKVKTK
jgi:hypothetical protein